MNLTEWAMRWGAPWPAVVELQKAMGLEGQMTMPHNTNVQPLNEDAVKNTVRLEASRKAILLWRNNVGALQDKDGRWVRYGLANDSALVNERVKSADLIGIRPVQILPHHVGHTFGQFVSREVKAPKWRYAGTPREEAQLRWLQIVQVAGGDAAFCTGEGSL